MAYYETAKICTNGHVFSSTASSEKNVPNFCERCGAPVVGECLSCKEPIRGTRQVGNFVVRSKKYDLPAYCAHCGAAYPWTESRIAVARQFASEISELTPDERVELGGVVEALVRQTPAATAAEGRFKLLMKKAGKSAADGMRSIVIDVLSEAVKKSLFP